jgi:transposase
MQVVYPRCCGLDIHKKTIVACVLLTDADGAPRRFVRTYGTMTADLLALGDWLRFHAVTHVAMESTGVLWRPVFNVREEEGRSTLILVKAQHIKALPGRKTDVKESEWLADPARALACSRRASFPRPRSAGCAISPASARRSLNGAPKSPIVSTRC